MPEQKTRRAVARDKREGKSASTQAGEFVHEEIEHVREGKHGVQNTRQAIAIGLSKARRAGIDVEPGDGASAAVKKKARKDIAQGKKTAKRPAAKRSAGARKALKTASKKTARKAVSHTALSKQAKQAASKRSAADRSAAAKKAARTKGPAKRAAAARKAVRTRASKD